MVWDAGHSTYRKSLLSSYKERGPIDEEKLAMLEEWKSQVDLLQKYLPYLGVGQIKVKGCEADDLIFRLKKWWEPDAPIVIASTDADFMQLIDENCRVYNFSGEKLIDSEDVIEIFGVAPNQWVEFRAMTGDSSDNIPGVEGVGPKRSSRLLEKWSCLKNFYENFKSIESPKKWETQVLQDYVKVERNRLLMDLSRLPESEIPQLEFDMALLKALELRPDYEAFWKLCNQHQLNLVMEERPVWSTAWGE